MRNGWADTLRMIYVVVLGVVLLAAWFIFAMPTRRLVRYLRTDDIGIHLGPSDLIPWRNLREVHVETTAGGPWKEDFFIVLVAGGRRPVRIPEPLAPRILAALQNLPGFDNDALMRAVGSVEKAKFLCWVREGQPSS